LVLTRFFMNDFKGKVVFITGASSGIGAGLAREFAARGASLALAARRKDRLDELKLELEDQGGKALTLECDVTQESDQVGAVKTTMDEFGRLDVAVANAGFGVGGRVDKLGIDDFRRQFDTNVFGVLRTINATLPRLKQSRGTMVLMGSVSGHLSGPTLAPYSMSKYAVRALAEAMHGELEPQGVRTVLISPGFVESDIRRVDNKGIVHPDAKEQVPRWLIMPIEKAARQMVDAIGAGKREVVITMHGKAAVFLNRHFNPLMALAMRHGNKRNNAG